MKDLRRNLCEPMRGVKGDESLGLSCSDRTWQKNKRLDYI